MSDWWVALSSSYQDGEGGAHPTRRNIDIANAMSCHVPRFCLADVDVCLPCPWMMLHCTPYSIFSIPSARLYRGCTLHVACPSRNPKSKIQSGQHLRVQTFGHPHRQQAWTGCCVCLLGVFLCSEVPELQMQPSRLGQCSNLLPFLNNTTTHNVRP